MAEIRLNLDEADGGLPDICMCCGGEATITKTRKMSWCPQWVGVLIVAGLLPYLIVMLLLTKRAKVQVPLCNDHKGHWLYRGLIVGGSFLLFGFLGLVGFILTMALQQPGRNNDLSGIVCFGVAVLFLIWVIIYAVAQNTAIRPKEITESEITLQGVSNEFVEAMDEIDRERRARRKKRRQAREDDDDEEEEDPRPRKKLPASDGIVDKKRRRPAEEEEEEEPRPRKKKPTRDEIEED